MFDKLVVIEPVNCSRDGLGRLAQYAREVTLHDTPPEGPADIIRRVGDADAILLSHTTRIPRQVLEGAPRLRYIGLCASFYPGASNVDDTAARERGITVTGVSDYGDVGVGEFVVSELVRLAHGFGGHMLRSEPCELASLRVGVLGMGATGTVVARALRHFGSEILYYSRTLKLELERAHGYRYHELHELLPQCDAVCTCLNRGVVLLGERELALLGDGKIIINISLGQSFDYDAVCAWLERPGNYLIGDSAVSVDAAGALQRLPNVLCAGKSSGFTAEARVRLSERVVENIERFVRD